MNCHLSVYHRFLVLISFILCAGTSERVNSTFRPTREWQEIEEGQIIPAGLHVRVNLQTGNKEAKLPDNEDDKSNMKSLMASRESQVNSDDTVLNPGELKSILRNIKSDDAAKDSGERKFRSYDELKKQFNELNVQVKTDIEIITNLVDNFKKFDLLQSSRGKKSSDETDDEILSTLVDLEYLVHQYDNAKQFAKLNGFSEVIHKSLNSSNSEIRSEALRLLGSATQSNPKVQIAALDSGSINLLLKILTFDADVNVRSRSLYALSCLLRRFPAAQQKLMTDGGLTAFANVFDESKKDLLKLEIKIITLIHDLLFERKDTKMNILEEESNNLTNSKLLDLKERLKQYEKIDLEKKLVEQNWCGRISNWFVKQNFIQSVHTSKDSDEIGTALAADHDVIEKVIDTLYVMSDICKSQFKSDKELTELFLRLRDVYSQLALTESNSKENSSNQFYTSLSNVLKILTEKLGAETPSKDEL